MNAWCDCGLLTKHLSALWLVVDHIVPSPKSVGLGSLSRDEENGKLGKNGIPPQLPAAHGPLPGDDETARPPLPVSMLSPWAASKRPAGALSPTDVALFPISPCTD